MMARANAGLWKDINLYAAAHTGRLIQVKPIIKQLP